MSIREWSNENPEGKELTHGETFGIEHGWWLDFTKWGIGFDVERQFGNHAWPNRLWLAVQIGPLAWYVHEEWETQP